MILTVKADNAKALAAITRTALKYGLEIEPAEEELSVEPADAQVDLLVAIHEVLADHLAATKELLKVTRKYVAQEQERDIVLTTIRAEAVARDRRAEVRAEREHRAYLGTCGAATEAARAGAVLVTIGKEKAEAPTQSADGT